MIIETQLFTRTHISCSKEADTYLSVHRPLLCFAIGITAVIHKSREVSFGISIYDIVSVYSKEIVVTDIVLMILLHSLLACFFIYQLANIFNNEISIFDICIEIKQIYIDINAVNP